MTPERAFEEHHRAVYSFAYRLTGRQDVAGDIAQECFLSLLRAPERYDPARGSMKVYLFSIARNLALKQYRDERADPGNCSAADLGVADPAPDYELSRAVALAVAALPGLQREALVLFEYEGATIGEIAQISGVDEGTVKSRLFRARQNLRRELAAYRKTGDRYGTV